MLNDEYFLRVWIFVCVCVCVCIVEFSGYVSNDFVIVNTLSPTQILGTIKCILFTYRIFYRTSYVCVCILIQNGLICSNKNVHSFYLF